LKVYKNRTLHKAVGIPKHRNDFTREPPSPGLYQESQELGEANMEPYSEEELAIPKKRYREDEEGEEESGRYDIGDRKASSRKKWKRPGEVKHLPTVFTTDDDDDVVERSPDASLNWDEREIEEYDLDDGSGEDKRDGEMKIKSDTKRNYWLSKGLGRFNDDKLASLQ
jgi:hypothetical protein